MKQYKGVLAYLLVLSVVSLALCACASTEKEREFEAETTSLNKNIEADAYYQLGVSKINENDIQGAFVQLKKALDIEPRHMEALNVLGLVYLQLEDYENAKQTFLKAIKINKDFSDAYNNLGITYAKLQMWEDSIQAFKAAIQNPFYRTPDLAYNNLGYSYYRIKKYDDAIIAFKEAIKRAEQNNSPYYGLALVFNAQKRYGEASDSLMRAMQLDSKFKGDVNKARESFKAKLYSITGYEATDYINFLEIMNY
ncbi:MAG: tetratricopeptide repeat protein [Candidatus Magnetoovum sp. WYHC-5]|nr:tetratricopeptide repeat protein [Candidatus Magnetoovum sp. WYHC-5]